MQTFIIYTYQNRSSENTLNIFFQRNGSVENERTAEYSCSCCLQENINFVHASGAEDLTIWAQGKPNAPYFNLSSIIEPQLCQKVIYGVAGGGRLSDVVFGINVGTDINDNSFFKSN